MYWVITKVLYQSYHEKCLKLEGDFRTPVSPIYSYYKKYTLRFKVIRKTLASACVIAVAFVVEDIYVVEIVLLAVVLVIVVEEVTLATGAAVL